jgi:hypothetical protein
MAYVVNPLIPTWTQRMVALALREYDFASAPQHVTLVSDLYREYIDSYNRGERPTVSHWDVKEFPDGVVDSITIRQFGEVLNLAFPLARTHRCHVNRGKCQLAVWGCLGPKSFKKGIRTKRAPVWIEGSVKE